MYNKCFITPQFTLHTMRCFDFEQQKAMHCIKYSSFTFRFCGIKLLNATCFVKFSHFLISLKIVGLMETNTATHTSVQLYSGSFFESKTKPTEDTF